MESDSIVIHYGVKGMKWGIHKKQPKLPHKPNGEVVLSKNLKNGGKLVVRKKTFDDKSRLGQMLSSKKTFDKYKEQYPEFILTNKSGEKVGTASFYRSDKNTLELEWVGVNKAHRRQGYARGALEGVISYAKAEGITELNLTATEMGRPLYESLGFTRVPGINGGYHQLRIPETARHSDIDFGGFSDQDLESLALYISQALDKKDIEGGEEVEHKSKTVDNTLAHYGVKGMKWGRRKTESVTTAVGDHHVVSRNGRIKSAQLSKRVQDNTAPHPDAARTAVIKARGKKQSTDSLSNDQLREVINRRNLEKQYTLATASAGKTFVLGLLKQQGNQQANQFVSSQVKKAAKK